MILIMKGFFFIETSSYTNLMVGSRAEIHCGNVSNVTYTWRGPANETLPDPLIISSVSDNQSNYTCMANIPSNPMNCQTEEQSIALNVISKYEVVNCINYKNIQKFLKYQYLCIFIYLYSRKYCIFSDIF